MRYIHFFFSMLFIFLLVSCAPNFEKEVTEGELKSIIGFLAGDSLKGRFPGTAEDSVLTAYIVEKLDDAGLVPMAEEGMQPFEVEYGYTVGDASKVQINDRVIAEVPGAAFRPLGFSASDTVRAPYIYTDMNNPEASKPSSPEGRWLVTPLPEVLPEHGYDAYTKLRSIALEASDLGAAGVIFAAGSDALPEITHTKRLTLPVPAVMIGAKLMEEIRSVSASGNAEIEIVTEILPGTIPTFNTVAHLRGSDPERRESYVIVGAHHDHLGMGGRGSSSRMQDTIAVHYGADDNASGVAGVIQIAENIMSRSPARSFAFVTFGAEEMGILGSRYFAEHPTMELEKAQAMINMDMLGRLNEKRQLQIGGIGTSPSFRDLIDSINLAYAFNIKYSEAGYGPSDHSSFYAKDVPVLFISTGAHTDYHTPLDSEDRINYTGMVEVVRFISDLAFEIGNRKERLEFTMAGPKEPKREGHGYGKVTLGLMPDVTYEGSEGMPVSFVTEGKPAAAGGMKDGDIIVAVDGKRVGNVYDYMNRLGTLETGQSLIVKVLRDEEEVELLIQL